MGSIESIRRSAEQTDFAGLGLTSWIQCVPSQPGCTRSSGPTPHSKDRELSGVARGDSIYTEILTRSGHSQQAGLIPNATLQKKVIERIESASRGVAKA